ncbi:MAG TPA: hypothetical protein VFR09_06600 [Alphaproteobacteria bacterium]|nr:hypothetical protein [Alphaproteobacteria bacterium]
MSPTDIRLLCTALGFTAVVMQGDKISSAEAPSRAAGFAELIEAFCRVNVPEAFEETIEEANAQNR